MRIITAFFILISAGLKGQNPYEQLPFSTDTNHITVWNGESYVPFFIKGINLGIAKPGTFPGELAASKADYARWLSLIQDAGFNAIRVYTLHNPHFYHVLDSFNSAHPNKPIYFFQGIWLEEEIENYNEDLHTLKPSFQEELIGNISAVHGNVSIEPRQGKASGNFNTDVSEYLIGYIVGREIHPPEVWKTNDIHSETTYSGNYLSITDATPSEVWMTGLLDDVLTYEKTQFDVQHPISFSSWPTLDPLQHPGETNRYEDSVTIDLRKLDLTMAPGGYFASYHAYPYYPDFISKQGSYQGTTDYLGQNSYLAYLRDLKNHYANIPLLIAEFGASSSWGIAHYAQSGMHHGGSTEIEQGEAYLRMMWNFQETELAGGVQFAWIDEWFKRTWITDPLDYNPDRRILWHNITAAEQNFGLLGYRKTGQIYQPWESICTPCQFESVEAGVDYDFFHLKLNMGSEMISSDTLWIGLDTYSDALGESVLPDGKTINHRAEFALMVTQDQAILYVTEAYDTYGIWHGTSGPKQLYQSSQTDGSPWQIVRWKNNNTINEVQYIGRLGVNRLNLPLKSTDAVIITPESIEIRLPWTLLQFVDPSERKVMHDDRGTPVREEMTTDGVAIDLNFKNQSYSTIGRFTWENWQLPSDFEEYKKKSYNIIEQGLESIPSAPIAHVDTYVLTINERQVSAGDGVLSNDISFGPSVPQAYLIQSPQHGLLQLNLDGSFSYTPVINYNGADTFVYSMRVGPNWSEPVGVHLDIQTPLSARQKEAIALVVYPNPGTETIQFKTEEVISKVEIFNNSGILVMLEEANEIRNISVRSLTNGIYFIRMSINDQVIVQKFSKN